MSLVDVDSWLTEYEACERLNQTIAAQLTQREKRQKGSAEYNRLTTQLQVELKQFNTELCQLKAKLDASAKSHTITFEETERRQRQVETLQFSCQQLQRKYTNAERSDRAALFEQSPDLIPSSWQQQQADAAGDTTADRVPKDVETLKRRQIDILEEQNRGLEVLSQTISRQRALATQLGDEVETQNEIIDNLADTMDRVDTRVNVETGNIGQINRKDSTWGYWMIILVLLIAIVVVALL